MGVYSEAAAMQMREAQAVESFRFTDLLEFAVNTERNNQNMFNALLELDFQEAVAVQNGGYLTEQETEKSENKVIAKIKAIGSQIIKALEKFLETLGTFWNKLVLKVQEFTGRNKKLVTRFGSIVIADVKAGLGENSMKLTKYEDKDIFSGPLSKISSLRAEYTGLFDIAKTADDKGSVTDLVDEAVKKINGEDCSVSAEEMGNLFNEVDINVYLNDINYVKNLNENLQSGYKSQLAAIQSKITEAQAATKKDIAVAKKLLNPVNLIKNKPADYAVINANAKYRVCNALNAKFTGLLSQATKVAIRKMTVDRAAYIKLGKLADAGKKAAESGKKSEEAKTDEEKKVAQEAAISIQEAAVAECFLLELANDEYMEALFA